ncbi:ankyrin [Aaosphaeria arxii CBS 175.79]|uniref:Ankyrin n=1 Tax=Aaosphaeria arxii CBS 175.79 TaxID=1450172 RepID=A0A6A5XY89_9PLEO|nr:ankyrin [Aaosphaeria arxii CBS 175.79]KAF2018278.1 ankyrin [Aaosphaeria arxii CBS 175.79]
MAEAAYGGHSDILRYFMNNTPRTDGQKPWSPYVEAETDQIPKEWGSAVLPDLVVLYAAKGGKPSVMQTLIDYGLHVDHQMDKIGSPLAVAIINNNVELVQFLLSKGADPNDMYWIPQDTFLSAAAALPSTEILTLLLDHGADVESSMALNGAAEKGRIESAKILLDRGADVDQILSYPFIEAVLGTALHVAVKNEQEDFVKFLLEHGARKDLVNAEGLTPKDLAVSLGCEKIAKSLE